MRNGWTVITRGYFWKRGAWEIVRGQSMGLHPATVYRIWRDNTSLVDEKSSLAEAKQFVDSKILNDGD